MSHISRVQHRIGVVVPYTNTNLEPDLNMMRPDGVSLHFTRIAGYEVDSVPGTDAMRALGNSPIEEPINLLRAIQPDVILYGCSSATLALGREADLAFANRLTTYSGLPIITASNAVVDALKNIGVNKIAICTPYDQLLSEITAKFFEQAGFKIISISRIKQALDSLEQGAISPDEVIKLALEADQQEVEAIVMICTDLRAAECITHIESLTGKPIVSSNQALLYTALKMIGISSTTVPGMLGGGRE